jgi:bla regulator protein blaR1
MIGWLLETFLAVTLLMLLVLAVRRPVARHFGAGCAYALWLLPAVRLVLPPLPELFPSLALPPVAAFIPAMDGVAAPLPVESGPGQWVPFMLATWAGGAVTFLIWHWLTYRAFVQALRAGARPGDPPSYGGIATLSSAGADGPLALGLLDRWIVLPAHFARRYSPAEQRLAMEHELVHHRRGDILWNMAGLVLLALNWFNPVAWFAFHAFRNDQELACDAAVAKRASSDERHDYARALVKSASRPGLIAACPLNRAAELKRRLRMMRDHRVSAGRTAGGMAVFATLLAFGLAFSPAGQPGEVASRIDDEAAPAAPLLAAAASARAPSAAGPKAAAAHPARMVARVRAPAPGASLQKAEVQAAPAPSAQPEIRLAGLELEAGRLARLTRTLAIAPASAAAESPAAVRVEQAPALAAPNVGIRHDRVRTERIVTFRVHRSDARLMVASVREPEDLTRVHAAVARAIAQAQDEEARERLGELRDALERLDRIGMGSNFN